MEVDFSDFGEEDLEGGGSVIPGWYRCIVAEVKDNQFQAGNVDVQLSVTHGPYKGARIYDTIQDPQNAADTDKAKTYKARLAIWVTRSGMKTKEELAKQAVSLDFTELVGKEVFVKAVEDTYADKKTGANKSKVKPAFDGVYGLDDERVPEDVRRKNGVVVKPKGKDDAGSAPATEGKPKPPQGGTGAVQPNKKTVDKSRL